MAIIILLIAEFRKRKIEIEENKQYELRSLMVFDIKHRPSVKTKQH